MSDVRDNPEQHRFELDVEGHIAAAYYKLEGDVITFVHTEVPQALSGRGIGSKLAKGALDMVRARNLKVIAQCRSSAATLRSTPSTRICCGRVGLFPFVMPGLDIASRVHPTCDA
jgi:predicted GNAT family acetyltransferase